MARPKRECPLHRLYGSFCQLNRAGLMRWLRLDDQIEATDGFVSLLTDDAGRASGILGAVPYQFTNRF